MKKQTTCKPAKFGERGEWTYPRVVQVQFQNIASNKVSEFKNANKQIVVAPSEFESGNLIYPFARANAPQTI